MQVILFVGNGEDCDLCAQAEKEFRQRFKEEIKNDEAVIANMDEDEGAYEFWATHGLPLAPCVVITTESGKVVDQWDTGELPPAEEESLAANRPTPKEVASPPAK